jgi:hypothetical protein
VQEDDSCVVKIFSPSKKINKSAKALAEREGKLSIEV